MYVNIKPLILFFCHWYNSLFISHSQCCIWNIEN